MKELEVQLSPCQKFAPSGPKLTGDGLDNGFFKVIGIILPYSLLTTSKQMLTRRHLLPTSASYQFALLPRAKCQPHPTKVSSRDFCKTLVTLGIFEGVGVDPDYVIGPRFLM